MNTFILVARIWYRCSLKYIFNTAITKADHVLVQSQNNLNAEPTIVESRWKLCGVVQALTLGAECREYARFDEIGTLKHLIHYSVPCLQLLGHPTTQGGCWCWCWCFGEARRQFELIKHGCAGVVA